MLDDETDPAPPRVEVCGCTQSEVYRKALEDLAEKLERAAEIAPTPVRNFCSINAEFARSALASVAAPGGKPCSCHGSHPEWKAHSADGCGVTMAHAVGIGGRSPWL